MHDIIRSSIDYYYNLYKGREIVSSGCVLVIDKMKILSINILTALIISVKAVKVLDDSIYKLDSLLYTTENNIVDINYFGGNTDTVFIVQRDEDGSFKGLYAIETSEKNNTLVSTKVLDNGKCSTSDHKTVFIGASDGIFTYNPASKTTERYGNITADIKAIQKDSNDVIYVIANKHLSKVTEKGTKIEKIEALNEVHEVVLDKDSNMYLYECDTNAKSFEEKYKKPKVIAGGKVVTVKGLPDKYSQIKLIRSFASSEGVLLLMNKRIYRVFPNGTSVDTEYVFEKIPTSFYLDLGFIQLFGLNNKLYQFNIGPILQGLSSTIGDFYSSIFVE